MCLCMLRRSFLKTAFVTSALSACDLNENSRPNFTEMSSRQWLDVHCHVFNAKDVPLYEFIRNTRLSGAVGYVAAPLVALLAGSLQVEAPSWEVELRSIENNRPAVGEPEAISAMPGLTKIRNQAEPSLGRTSDPAQNIKSEELGALLDQALREAGIRQVGQGRSAATVPNDTELQDFDNLRLSRSGGIGSVIARYFDWGLLFTLDRNALVGKLAALYGSRTLMLTPAMVDYDLWLNAPDNALPGQTRVMAAIAASRSKSGTPVHAFLAFDPWRCIRDRALGADRLAELKTSIGNGDGIGVKLYPPMGFAPAGNATRSAIDFPRELQTLTGGNPGAALDAVMAELFSYCARESVPIMAHCGESNGSLAEYAKLAGPFYWEQALEAYPDLRLNLGHFGGIWDLGINGGSQQSWAKDIARLASKYPNVYADVGYFGSVLEDDPGPVLATSRFVAELANSPNSVIRNRLMYGSDWSMIGQEQSASRYPDLVLKALAGIWNGEKEEDLRWRNAARYLGLSKGQATRSRLDSFYARNELKTSKLHQFDPAL